MGKLSSYLKTTNHIKSYQDYFQPKPNLSGIITVLIFILIFSIVLFVMDKAEPAEINLPSKEIKIINQVADEYELKGKARLLLFVIRKIEAGRQGREFGVLNSKATDFISQARWAAGTIAKRFSGDLKEFADRYCPPNLHPLNRNWYRNAKFYMEKWK